MEREHGEDKNCTKTFRRVLLADRQDAYKTCVKEGEHHKRPAHTSSTSFLSCMIVILSLRRRLAKNAYHVTLFTSSARFVPTRRSHLSPFHSSTNAFLHATTFSSGTHTLASMSSSEENIDIDVSSGSESDDFTPTVKKKSTVSLLYRRGDAC